MKRLFGLMDDGKRRYLAISLATGTMDILIALLLLHLRFSMPFSLGVSIVVAGIVAYFALEWWVFRRRGMGMSWRRMAGSGLVELGTYLIRVAVLWLFKRFFPGSEILDHLIGLAVAYAVAFVFGYVARSRFVFD